MQNIKTGIVVALLLAVCYGAFKALNEPEPELPPELNEWVSNESNLDDLLDVDLGHSGAFTPSNTSLPNIALPSDTPTTGEFLKNAQTPAAPALIDPTASNSVTLGGTEALNTGALNTGALNTGAPAKLSVGADGPSIQIPGDFKTASQQNGQSDSLVPDTFPSSPIAAPASLPTATLNPTTIATPTSISSADSSFPSIPLPSDSSGTVEQSKLVGTAATAGSVNNVTLPLLPDNSSLGQKTDAASTAQPDQPVLEAFSAAREKALKLATEGKLKDALVLLTPQYRSPVISSAERSDLLDILDTLAGQVIFSPRHLLTAPYVAKATDTVESVATQFKITPELLANVNQLAGAKVLTQGQQVKVFEGPFRGEVDLTIGELTLFLKDMYACRFPISVGSDPVKVGAFEVAEKQRDRTYYGAGKVIEASNPSNPYGGFWIDLGQGNCLHGSPEMAASDLTNAGCIGLSPIDASDAYIILTRGSQVVIRR